MKIILLGVKGGSGRSTTSLALAHGLALVGREVTLIEYFEPGRQPSFAPDQALPFRYLPVNVQEPLSGTGLVERITDAGSSGDLVVDPPPLNPEDAAKLLPGFDLVLVPLHPDPADLRVAQHFLEELEHLQPGWKAIPPRWLVHIDPVQSLRGTLPLVDALVKNWKSQALPPLVLPYPLPRFSRPELRALSSGKSLEGTLAASCRILAVACTEIVSAPQELLLPRALEDRLPDELKARFRGEDRTLAEKFMGLAADIAAIRADEGPQPSDLLGVPVLDDWTVEPFQASLLAGEARGHPRLGSQQVRTTMAVLIDENEHWARTLSRFYRLGRKAKRPSQDHGPRDRD